MTDLGTANRRTARTYEVRGAVAVPRRERRSDTDRYGRRLNLRNAEGYGYEPCVMCEKRSMVRHKYGCRKFTGDHHCCERCGYADTDLKPLV